MAGSVSTIEGARTAYGFLRRAWLPAVGALSLCGLLGAVAGFALISRDFQRAPVLVLASSLATVMARGALFRNARGDGAAAGLAGFQWGAVEWRLLAVTALRWVLFGLLIGLLLTVLGVVYVGLAAADAGPGGVASPQHWRRVLSPVGWLVFSGVSVAGVVGLCWVDLRLYLAFAATLARGRVQLLSAWVLTRGAVLRILGGVILILAPTIVVGLAARLVRGGPALGSRDHWPLAIGCLIASFSQAFLALPLSVGLMTYLHDRLGPDDAGVSP